MLLIQRTTAVDTKKVVFLLLHILHFAKQASPFTFLLKHLGGRQFSGEGTPSSVFTFGSLRCYWHWGKETVAFDASATASASESQSETPMKAGEGTPSPLNRPPPRCFSEKVKGEGCFTKCGLGRGKMRWLSLSGKRWKSFGKRHYIFSKKT